MRKCRIVALLAFCSLLTVGISSAGPIMLNSIGTNNIAVLGYDVGTPAGTNVTVSNSGSSHINVTGNVVSPLVNGASGLNFLSGGTVTSGAVLTNAESDLASVVTQLNGLSYTALTITSGATTTISIPGDYSVLGVLGANTVINLTGSGPYIFKTTGNLTLTNVTINGNASLSSDDVFWYTTGAVGITNSKVFGDVVQGSGGNDVMQTAAVGGSLTGSLTGRFLSEASTTSLTAAQGSTLTINDVQSAVPEPSTFAFVFLGLGGLAAAIRRRR